MKVRPERSWMGRFRSESQDLSGAGEHPLIVTPNAWSPARILVTRLGIVGLLFCLVFSLLW
jgi:hypothetical protein